MMAERRSRKLIWHLIIPHLGALLLVAPVCYHPDILVENHQSHRSHPSPSCWVVTCNSCADMGTTSCCRYLLVLERKTCGRQLHLAKRFGPKRAFFSCRKGYKTNLLYLLLSLGQIKGACKFCLINCFLLLQLRSAKTPVASISLPCSLEMWRRGSRYWSLQGKVRGALYEHSHIPLLLYTCTYSIRQYNIIVPFLRNETKTERPFPLYETPHPFRRNGRF